MVKFVLAYGRRPDIKSKDDGADHIREWNQGLGDAVVDPGLPAGASMTVSKDGVTDGGGANLLSGITIIQAETTEDAVGMVTGCPHRSGTGTIEIAQAMEMDM